MSPRRPPSTLRATPDRAAPRTQIVRLALAAMLGVAAALLVACGSSAGKLIPVADSGPLQGDFETVVVDAESANGKCSTTEAALAKTEQDFTALPASVDSGLRATLRQGIDNLRARALTLCAQPLALTTPTSTTSQPSTSTATTPTTTPSTTTPTTTTSTTPTTTSPGGGTPAEPGEATPGSGGAPGEGGAPGGGTGAGEGPSEGAGALGGVGNGNGHGNGNGGQEGGK
jgi:hypothetical protein